MKYSPIKFGPSRTQQHFRDATDINLIVARARKAGGLPPSSRTLLYIDVSNVPDYQTAQNIVIQANESFAALPAKARERFQNDPGKMMEFLQNKDNLSEAVKLGLVKAESIANGENNTEQKKPVAKGKSKGEAKPNATDPDLPLD